MDNSGSAREEGRGGEESERRRQRAEQIGLAGRWRSPRGLAHHTGESPQETIGTHFTFFLIRVLRHTRVTSILVDSAAAKVEHNIFLLNGTSVFL